MPSASDEIETRIAVEASEFSQLHSPPSNSIEWYLILRLAMMHGATIAMELQNKSLAEIQTRYANGVTYR